MKRVCGSMAINSRNVIRVIGSTASGLKGVTPRSRYYIGDAADALHQRAAYVNARRDSEFNFRVHRAE